MAAEETNALRYEKAEMAALYQTATRRAEMMAAETDGLR